MENCSHVCLGAKPVRWNYERTLNTIVYDDYHEEIVLLRGSPISKILISDKLTLEWREYPLKILTTQPLTQVLCAKLSPEKTCLALRVSDKEVKVIDSAGVVVTRSCRGSRSVMLAIHWLKNDLLLFVTNNGVELYAFKVDKLKHIKTAPYAIKYHWFLVNSNRQSEEDILLLVDDKNIFQAYQITSKNITKICKFFLDCSNTSFETPPKGDKFFSHQLTLCMLYGKIVCVFVNEKKGNVHLLRISTDAMDVMHKYELLLAGRYATSVIDNIVVLHNIKEQVSMLFDVRGDSKSPLVAPLPIGHYENERIDSEFWTFIGGKYILDSKPGHSEGTLYRVELNFEAIAQSWPAATRTRLIDFLLKRSTIASKTLVLEIIKQLVLAPSPSSLSVLSRLFTTLNRICYDAKLHSNSDSAAGNVALPIEETSSDIRHRWSEVKDEGVERNANGYIIIHQSDMYFHVFEPARQAVLNGKIPGGQLIAPVTEYMRSVCRHYLRPESLLNDLLVALLVEEKRYYEFHQYLQYHILNDSPQIAEILLELSSTYPPAYQLGLDMLYRLKEFGRLLKVMLEARQVIAALRLVSHRSPLFDERGLTPRDFLRIAMEDNQVFYSTFEYFRARNLALRNSPVFIREDGTEEFEQHFQKLFGNEERKKSSYFMDTKKGDDRDDGANSDDDSGPGIIGDNASVKSTRSKQLL